MFVKICLLLSLLLLVQTKYEPKLAKELVTMCSISNEPAINIDKWNCTECKKYKMLNVKAYTQSDVQMFSGFSTSLNGIIVCFRGSSNIPNWLANLDFHFTSYSSCHGCEVHAGFFKTWEYVKAVVMSHIQHLRSLHRDAPIFMTGHSLGGALATLGAVDVHHTYGLKELYTFGEPRVGNPAFSAWYKNVIISHRVIHYADIVPHVPLSKQGFLHEGKEVWYNQAMSTYKLCEYGQDQTCCNSHIDLSTNDHDIHLYERLPGSIAEEVLMTAGSYLDLLREKKGQKNAAESTE